MTLEQFLNVIAPVLGGCLGSGGIVAYYAYKSNKPKTAAEAQRINADVVVTFAEGWKAYAEKLEMRLDATEAVQADLRREIGRLQSAIRDQDEKNRQTLQEKNDQIYRLQAKNQDLERRVGDLEEELLKYRQAEQGKGSVV